MNKDDKKAALRKYKKSNLIHDSNNSFLKYHIIEKFNNNPLKSKYSLLINIFNDLDQFRRLKAQKEKTKGKK